MRSRHLAAMALAALVCGASHAALSAPAYHAPRTSWGAADLEGTWTNQTATRLERPKAYKALVATEAEMQARTQRQAAAKAAGVKPQVQASAEGDGDVGQGESEFIDENTRLMVIDGRPRTSVITDPADGRLPYTAEARKRAAELGAPDAHGYDGPEQRDASERCIAEPVQAGPPLLSGPDNANLQIIETPDRVGILSELIHELRVVRLGGAHPEAHIPTIQGDSIGRWAGDELVIETVDQSPLVAIRSLDGSTLWLPPSAKVVEHLRRISPTEILYRFTVTDPAIYTRPWSGEMVLRRVDKPIYEYACHEGNYALANVLSGAREREKRAAAPPPPASSVVIGR